MPIISKNIDKRQHLYTISGYKLAQPMKCTVSFIKSRTFLFTAVCLDP